MDKKYYYRVLGVKEAATAQQIKQGYEERVKRLKSPDYADDPEYVDRKLKEAAYAYRVLLGAEIPSAKRPSVKQVPVKRSKKEHDSSPKITETVSDAGNKLKKNAGKTLDRITDSKEAKSVLGVIFSLIIAVASMAISSCDSL